MSPEMPLTDFCAKTPTTMEPTTPPVPWQANTSSASSTCSLCIRPIMKKQMRPTMTPMATAAHGSTYPADGVIATRPTTAPTSGATVLNFLCSNQPANSQTIIAAEAVSYTHLTLPTIYSV